MFYSKSFSAFSYSSLMATIFLSKAIDDDACHYKPQDSSNCGIFLDLARKSLSYIFHCASLT